MKTNFFSFVKKETLHILRDKRTMLIVILIPIILMLLFGFAISTEVNNVKVAVVAENRSESIKKIVDKIGNNPYITFLGYIERDQIDEYLRRGKAIVIAVFDTDYDRKEDMRSSGCKESPSVQIITDASDPNTASTSTIYLQNVMSGKNIVQQLFETRLLFNPQMKSAYNFVPGIMGMIFILVCALMTSVSIVREKEMGTMEVLLVSPVNPRKIIFSKMIPYFVISCITLTIILLLARYLLEVPLVRTWEIITVSLIYLILSLSLGLFVSTLAKTQVVAMLISAAVMMLPVIMLSGMVFPIENMPKALQYISEIIPARWYIDAMRKLMIEGLPLTSVATNVLILCVMILALIGGSMKKFKNKLE